MNYDRFLTRVWDKETQKMLYCKKHYLGVTDTSVIYEDVEEAPVAWAEDNITFVEYDYKDHSIPMQCTGLKDDNEKLIYEGDIIGNNLGEKTVIKGEVIWWECEFLIDANKAYYIDIRDIEIPVIIGNIYENPELMV